VAAVLLAVTAFAAALAPYDPTLDGSAQLRDAGRLAATSGRRVLVVVGGNWCVWCRALDSLMTGNEQVRQALAGFEVVHLNYSKENKNAEALSALGHPDALGFPALVVLSPDLKVLHAASSEPFETGGKSKPGHDPAKLAAFLRYWSR
jgi:thiol-disulfide isomerase/thioredoxin